MIYSKVTLTSKGLEMLAKVQATGEKLVIDSLALGKGGTPLLESSERLSEQMQTFQFDSITQKENHIALKVSVNNKNLNEGYEIRELGIFAKYEEEKILYAFINAEGGDYDKLNAYETEADFKEIIFYIELVVSDTDNFKIALTEEGLRQDFGALRQEFRVLGQDFETLKRTIEESVETKIELLKNSVITRMNNNVFIEDFSDLESVKIKSGIFNEELKKIYT